MSAALVTGAAKRLGRADKQQAAAMDHRHTAAHLLDIGQGVRSEEHGAAIAMQTLEPGFEPRARFPLSTSARVTSPLLTANSVIPTKNLS